MFPAPNWYLQRTCSWSENGRRVVLASRDSVILLQRGEKGKLRAYANLRAHKAKVTAVRFFRGMCVKTSTDGGAESAAVDLQKLVF